MCSDWVGGNYTSNPNGSYYLYPTLINDANLRIWIYSGDTDTSVPITGTLYWISLLKQQLGLNDIVSWRPWFTNGTVPNERQNAG